MKEIDKRIRSATRQFVRAAIRSPKHLAMCADAVARQIEALPPGASIALYGCGGLATTLVSRHRAVLQGRQNLCFLVTERQFDRFLEFPVISLPQARRRPPDVCLLMSAIFEQEMRAHLAFLPREQIIGLQPIVEMYGASAFKTQARRELCAHVAAERDRIVAQLPAGRPIVVFATQNPALHTLKHISEVTRRGFATILAVERVDITEGISLRDFEVRGYFGALFESSVSFPLEVLELVSGLDVLLIHAEAAMWTSEPLAYLLEHKTCPVVVEYRDFKELVFPDDETARRTLRLSKADFSREWTALRTVFQKADGIIYKDSPESIALLERKHRHSRPNAFHFFHYCSDLFVSGRAPGKLSAVDGEIRVVYAGNLSNDPTWHNYPIFSSLLRAAKILADQRIHLTVLNAVDSSGVGFEDYLELDRQCPYFHYRFALPYHELGFELGRHDFGWLCFDFSRARESADFLRVTMGSKIFSYLEAGLPILVSPEQAYMAEIVESMGIGQVVGFKELPRLGRTLSGIDRQALADRITAAREDWSYRRHIPRLLEFYRAVAAQPPRRGAGRIRPRANPTLPKPTKRK